MSRPRPPGVKPTGQQVKTGSKPVNRGSRSAQPVSTGFHLLETAVETAASLAIPCRRNSTGTVARVGQRPRPGGLVMDAALVLELSQASPGR